MPRISNEEFNAILEELTTTVWRLNKQHRQPVTATLIHREYGTERYNTITKRLNKAAERGLLKAHDSGAYTALKDPDGCDTLWVLVSIPKKSQTM